ncbi:MAG TPA: DUF427 domain-containing protein [Acidimicrobiales bacterium]|nr:DUF427 domain-containing protein [Acidimicrobiales bacterium]
MSAPRIEPGAKRVRAWLGGELVVDTIRPMLVWEGPGYPAYYLPAADVRMELLIPTAGTKHSPDRGDAVVFDVKGGTKVAEGGAWQYAESPVDELRGLVRFDWAAMDHWFEEDEEVFVHPRSPYTRVDILPSSRRVRVELGGVVVAESTRPWLLFETGLPTRYYLPLVDVRMDLLRPSGTHTSCPYKGTASYWSVEAGGQLFEDVAWYYPTPLPESERVAGLVSFFNEKVDLYVDGVLQERPKSKFA